VTASEALLGICLALSSAPSETVYIGTSAFTLAWTHSIEKQRWEEDYQVVRRTEPQKDVSQPVLIPGRSRIKGSGAGMEPGPDSVWVDGWFSYQPAQSPLELLRLSRSFYTEDYSLCINNRCRGMSEILPSDGGITLLWACEKNSFKSAP
jgi:hypothetical protein